MDLIAPLAAAVKTLLLPPAGLLLLYAGGMLAARRGARGGRLVCHGAVALLYLLSTGAGSWLLAHPLESLEAPLTAAAAQRGQAIVVLTAGRIKHSPEYGARAMPDFVALARMTYAAHLARSSGLPLMATGGLISDKPDDEALALGMRRVFEQDFGLPVRWVETRSRTTAENARFSAPMLRQAGVERIILVTDAMHMRRARLAFEREGIAVISAPTFYAEPAGFEPGRLWPTAENLRRSHYALYEWIGLAWYRLR